MVSIMCVQRDQLPPVMPRKHLHLHLSCSTGGPRTVPLLQQHSAWMLTRGVQSAVTMTRMGFAVCSSSSTQ